MKEKIKDFMEDNWLGVIIAAATVVADVAICKIYKDYLDKH
jgi:hypothetical protein